MLQDPLKFKRALRDSKFKVKEIVTNGNTGTGFQAEVYALRNEIPLKLFKPEYSLFRGKIRVDHKYQEMIDYSDGALILKTRNYPSNEINEFLNLTKKKKNFKTIIKEVKE